MPRGRSGCSASSATTMTIHGRLELMPPAGHGSPPFVKAVKASKGEGGSSPVKQRPESSYEGTMSARSSPTLASTDAAVKDNYVKNAQGVAGVTSGFSNRVKIAMHVNPNRLVSTSWILQSPDEDPASGPCHPVEPGWQPPCAGAPSSKTQKYVNHNLFVTRKIGNHERIVCEPAPPHQFGIDWVERRNKDARKYKSHDLTLSTALDVAQCEPGVMGGRPLRRTNYNGKGNLEYCWKHSSGKELPSNMSKRQIERIKDAKNLSGVRGETYHIAAFGGEDLKPGGTDEVLRTDRMPSDELVRHNDFHAYPDVPLTTPGTRPFMKSDLPPSPELIRFNAKKVLALHDRGGNKCPNPHLCESPDMFYTLWAAPEDEKIPNGSASQASTNVDTASVVSSYAPSANGRQSSAPPSMLSVPHSRRSGQSSRAPSSRAPSSARSSSAHSHYSRAGDKEDPGSPMSPGSRIAPGEEAEPVRSHSRHSRTSSRHGGHSSHVRSSCASERSLSRASSVASHESSRQDGHSHRSHHKPPSSQKRSNSSRR